MELFLFPEMCDVGKEKRAEKTVEVSDAAEEKRAEKTVRYPAGAEKYPELVQILDEIRVAGKDLKQSEDTWAKFVPVLDKAQNWFSRKGKDHVKLPKGLTWTKIKDWSIDALDLGFGRRQFERRLRAHRITVEQPEKKPAVKKSKRNTAKALGCADAIAAAYRAGQDLAAHIEAYERARFGEDLPPDHPAKITAAPSIGQNPATTVIGETAASTPASSAVNAGSQPRSSGPSSEPITPSTRQSNALAVPKVATPAPARSAAKTRIGSSNEEEVRVVPFKKSAQAVAPELKPTLLHPFGDCCLYSLSGAGTGDGAWEFNPERLYQLREINSVQRIFISDTYDLFDERVPVEVIVEHLRVFAALPWVFFSLLTEYSSRLGQIQSALNSLRMGWPRNLEVGLSLNCSSNIDKRLKAFNLHRVERKWLCFLPFESNEGHPMSRECSSLPSILEQAGRPRIVVGGRIDRQSGRSSLSAADAKFLIDSAQAAGSKVFYSPESAKLAFERGDSLAQIVNEINLDQQAAKGTFYGLDRSRELPDFRFSPVGKVQSLARNYRSVLRLKPVRHTYSRFELEFGRAAQWP